MFLHRFNDLQKKSFLILSQKLMQADSLIRPEEEYLIDLMKKEMNIDSNVSGLDAKPVPELCRSFEDNKTKVMVLLELINLGYVDNEYCDSEKSFVKNISMEFGLSPEKLKLCEEWVSKKVSLFKEIEKI
jgi:hypothetical protein